MIETRRDSPLIRRLRSAGVPAPQTPEVTLRAGPLTLQYGAGSIRCIRAGEHEVVRQVYFALRDRNWNTIEGAISEEEVQRSETGFTVTFLSTHEAGQIRFRWRGRLQGETDGRLVFTMEGKAEHAFLRNRIGFCILHPMEVAGKPCTVTHPDGTTETAPFPEHISPYQPFRAIGKLSYPVSADTGVVIELEGEVFEMEDQRNWTDASFKTYSTPLDLPFPVEQPAGSTIRQSVTILPRVTAPAAHRPAARKAPEGPVTITILPGERFPLPGLGFTWRPIGTGNRELMRSRLRSLHPDHLRLEMPHGRQQPGRIGDSLAEAARLEAPLELAVFLGRDEEADLQAAAQAVKESGASLARVLVFKQGKKSTPTASLAAARKVLGSRFPGVDLCAGTDAFFAEVNRERPDMTAADGVTFSINPQVHVFDNRSLVESLAAQHVTISTARSFSSGKPVHVSPVSFRMRWNPNATFREADGASRADPRQLSLFGAAWTAGSIKSLAQAGVDSVTYFETMGSLGLMEEEVPSLDPDLFPSIPGGVFPIYYVFRELARFKGGPGVRTRSSEPLSVDALAVEKDGGFLVILCNYADREAEVIVDGVKDPVRVRLHSLDSYEINGKDPDGYFERERRGKVREGRLDLALPPQGIAYVTFQFWHKERKE